MILKFSPGDIVSFRIGYSIYAGYIKNYDGGSCYTCISIMVPYGRAEDKFMWSAGLRRCKTASIRHMSLNQLIDRYHYYRAYGRSKSVILWEQHEAHTISSDAFIRRLRAFALVPDEMAALKQHVFKKESDHWIPSWELLKDKELPYGNYVPIQ
jgi:hypothetical protein